MEDFQSIYHFAQCTEGTHVDRVENKNSVLHFDPTLSICIMSFPSPLSLLLMSVNHEYLRKNMSLFLKQYSAHRRSSCYIFHNIGKRQMNLLMTWSGIEQIELQITSQKREKEDGRWTPFKTSLAGHTKLLKKELNWIQSAIDVSLLAMLFSTYHFCCTGLHSWISFYWKTGPKQVMCLTIGFPTSLVMCQSWSNSIRNDPEIKKVYLAVVLHLPTEDLKSTDNNYSTIVQTSIIWNVWLKLYICTIHMVFFPLLKVCG